MKRIARLATFTCLLLSVSMLTFADGDGWIVDFEKAKTIASKEKKDLLMDFTGSDWCGYCIKLNENVFSKEEFKKEIPKHFVLLKLDFPKDKSKQTEAEIAQNKELNEKYKVSGYPTILLADASGRPFAQTVGYGGEPADVYTKNLLDMRESRIKRDEFFAKAKAAGGVEKAKFLDQAVALFDPEMAMSIYREEIDLIIALDKDNEAGLKNKYEEMAQIKLLQEKVGQLMQANRGNAKGAIEALDKLYAEMKPEGALAVEILYPRSFMKYQDKDMEGAKADLEACVKAIPDSLRAQEIQEIIQRVFEKEEEKDTKEEK